MSLSIKADLFCKYIYKYVYRHNSSLKFEIKAKQFYAASQRVL